jgi:MHS family proline/betaine transporter-like MFS transporter
VLWVTTLALGLSALAMPLAGMLGDRIGLIRLLALGFTGFIVLTYPLMATMHVSLFVATLAYIVIMMNSVAAQVGAYTLLPQLFDQEARYTGVAMGWNLGVIVAGGTAPYAAVWLVERTGNILAPAFFVIALAIVGLATVASVRPDHTRAAER